MAVPTDVFDTNLINLHVGTEVFTINKELLCTFSDYFNAMFSGRYIEREKKDIIVDVVDLKSMQIIAKFITTRRIVLTDFTLPTMGNLAMAVNYLQITQLIQLIDRELYLRLSPSTWIEIMGIAETALYANLEQQAGAYGLLEFKNMKPEYIPNIQKLFWYLSNPALNTDRELDVFKFGYEWILRPETCCCADILLVILGCLDVTKLTGQDLKRISNMLIDCNSTFSASVVNCLKMIMDTTLKIDLNVLLPYKYKLLETFSEEVFNEVYKLVKFSNERSLVHVPVLPMYPSKGQMVEQIPDNAPWHLYKFNNHQFDKWIDLEDELLWGWSITNWGSYKLVLVCGERGRATGMFFKDVKVFDTLRLTWTWHGVQLPCRRHAGVTILGDLLFIVGGVGRYRIVKDTTIIYDLKKKYFVLAKNFVHTIQSPAVCTHYGSVYAAGHTNIFKFKTSGNKRQWVPEMTTDVRITRMVSFKEHIYIAQSFHNSMYRFRPGICTKMEIVAMYSSPPSVLCNVNDVIEVFFKSANHAEQLTVEEFNGPCTCIVGACPRNLQCGRSTLWETETPDLMLNDVSGSCSLVMDMPNVLTTPSHYHQKLLSRYAHITYNK